MITGTERSPGTKSNASTWQCWIKTKLLNIKPTEMSIKFQIRNTSPKAQREGNHIVRFSGTGEPFNRKSEREAKKVGVDAQGNIKLRYNTGLDETKVAFLPWYNEQERKEVLKQIKEFKPIIIDYYGGEDVIQENNQFFWRDVRSVNILHLTHSNIELNYDTANPSHALLYLSVISGAFADLVGPTRDWAEANQLPHYLQLETEGYVDDDDESINRSDAHAALADLRKEGQEALFILAWCLQYDTQAYGAYLRSTPTRNLVDYHIKYIEGKLSLKKKRNTPKTFIEYYNRWKGQQTRPALLAEAYLKAGEYYNFVQQKQKKYTLANDTVLGATVNEAVDTLMKAKSARDLAELRDQVEAKWKE